VPFGITIAYTSRHRQSRRRTPTATASSSTRCSAARSARLAAPLIPARYWCSAAWAYDNGSDVHAFLSRNFTVANNTVFNNYLDLLNPATARGESSNGGSQNVTCDNKYCGRRAGFRSSRQQPAYHQLPCWSVPRRWDLDQEHRLRRTCEIGPDLRRRPRDELHRRQSAID
jgi:hypothetical protein